MNKYELIAAVIAFAIFAGVMIITGNRQDGCRIEAIKAGMKADDVSKACGR